MGCNLPMKSGIVQCLEPIALIGGGDLGKHDLALVLARSILLVAADGGAAAALRAGRIPDAVIGDFDSLTASDAAQIPKSRLHHVAEQEVPTLTRRCGRLSHRWFWPLAFWAHGWTISWRRSAHWYATLTGPVF